MVPMSGISIAGSLSCTEDCVLGEACVVVKHSQPVFVVSRSTHMRCSWLLTGDERSFPGMLTEQDSRYSNMREKQYYSVTLQTDGTLKLGHKFKSKIFFISFFN